MHETQSEICVLRSRCRLEKRPLTPVHVMIVTSFVYDVFSTSDCDVFPIYNVVDIHCVPVKVSLIIVSVSVLFSLMCFYCIHMSAIYLATNQSHQGMTVYRF